jgi:hypothetical protein
MLEGTVPISHTAPSVYDNEQSVHTQTMQNSFHYDGIPPQGLSEARRAGSFSFINPPRGRPLLVRRRSS